MANQKQDGSNCINVEYSTGRCATRCEQCFVNYGQQGQATCLGTVNPGSEKLLKWLKEEGQRFGRYKLPPPPGRPKLPPGHERLLRKITRKGSGFTNIPTKAAWVPWVVKQRSANRKKLDTVKGLEHYGRWPYFLRVSSMSDSSWAPEEWVRLVQDAWGDYCFFNSAIRSVVSARQKYGAGFMDNYHKLVVTANPGFQQVREMRPRATRAKNSSTRTSEREAWKRRNRERLSAFGSMLKKGSAPRDLERDFLHPQSLSDVGLGGYEDIIKFYRLRGLPTVLPLFETDRPTVITQMRFKGLDHLLEWVRRYGLNAEIRSPRNEKGEYSEGTLFAVRLAHRWGLDVDIVPDDSLSGKQVLIWSDKRDGRNASAHRGEASVYMWDSGFYRPLAGGFREEPYVCDRNHGSCAHCGLCASLDGTEQDWANPLNVAPPQAGGMLLAPLPGPEGAGYIGSGIPETETGGYFRQELAEAAQEYGGDMPGTFSILGYHQNPAREPAHPDWCISQLEAVAAYVDKGMEIDSQFCESWNTHEDSATMTAYCVWSLLVHARREGWSKQKAFENITALVEDVAGPYDVLDGIGDVWGMWDGESDWCDQFGEVR